MAKPVTYLNRCRLSKEEKEEIKMYGELTHWGAATGYMYRNTFYIVKGKVKADTFAGNGRYEQEKIEKKSRQYTFNLG